MVWMVVGCAGRFGDSGILCCARNADGGEWQQRSVEIVNRSGRCASLNRLDPQTAKTGPP